MKEGYIRSEGNEIDKLKNRLGGELPRRSLLEQFRPRTGWFLRGREQAMGIHGITHITRVLIWQETLVGLIQKDTGRRLNRTALRWAAVTHDLRRVDDKQDPEHGARAARWIERNLRGIIPVESFESVKYLNTWHVPADNSAPGLTPELSVFKDADALDRARINNPKFTLNPNHLRNELAKGLIQPARLLYLTSSQKSVGDPGELFDSVLDTAAELGIIL